MINFDTLAATDCLALLNTSLTFFDSMAIYSVDQQQNVLVWGGKMAELSGLSLDAAIGQPCMEKLRIDASTDPGAQFISLPLAEGGSMQLIRQVQVLYKKMAILQGE